MQLNEYQVKAMSFRLPTAGAQYALLNLSGEVGELHSKVAKALRDGVKNPAVHNVELAKEVGDVLWQLTAVAVDLGFDLETIATMNIDKLSLRKAQGVIQGSGDNRTGDWDEKRMDTIGQNGNEGDHYDL